MRRMRIASYLVPGLLVLALCTGCLTAKPYRPVGKLTPVAVAATPDATDKKSIAQGDETALPVGKLCRASAEGGEDPLTPAGGYRGRPESGPCLAFVEYDKGGGPAKGVGDQMGSALALVRKAIADDPQHQPIIVTFVHGWKHNDNPGNAAPGRISRRPPEDENVQGFEHVLNYLYRCYYANPLENPCVAPTRQRVSKSTPMQGHVVVGIYFSWYGADISSAFPVTQQITVYSRGKEADLVARVGVFSRDLKRLSEVAHPTPKAEKEPLLILVGHSFGARLLEQAVEKPMEERVSQQIAQGENGSLPNFADLVLYVNAAAAAKNGMNMLGFLAKNQVQYRTLAGPAPGPEPLIASITTPADAATGVAFSIAMYPGSVGQKGVESLQGFDSGAQPGDQVFPITEQLSKLSRNTLGHLTEFQSHVLNEVTTSACEGGQANDFYFSVPEHCFHVTAATALPGEAHRWNGTPYWVISTDQNVIPDHGTIFTNRFMRFVGHVLPDESFKPVVTGVPVADISSIWKVDHTVPQGDEMFDERLQDAK